MDSAGGVGVAAGGGDVALRARDRRMRQLGRRMAMWRMTSMQKRLRRVRLFRVRLLLGKRCGRVSGGRSRVRVAADGIVEVEIAVGGTVAVVDETGVCARLLECARREDGIRAWIRCGSGLLLEGRGRDLRTMNLWI